MFQKQIKNTRLETERMNPIDVSQKEIEIIKVDEPENDAPPETTIDDCTTEKLGHHDIKLTPFLI